MTDLPGGTTAEALAAVLRRHGVRAAERDCARVVAAAGPPDSLATLARAAAACGVEAEAFEAGWDDLVARRLPAVLHVADGDIAAFAVVVDRDESSLLIDAGDERVTRLARERLADVWRGVVLFCPAIDAARAEEALRGAAVPAVVPARRQEPDGDPGASVPDVISVARWLALAAGLAAAARGGWRVGEGIDPAGFGRAAGLLLVAIATLGLATTLILARASRRVRGGEGLPALVRAVCREGALTDCRGVLASRWASFLGVDFATWGAVFWGALVGSFAIAGLPGPGQALPAFVAAGLACIAVLPVALLLVVVQLAVLRRVCALCMASHALVAFGAVCGLLLARAPGAERSLDAARLGGAAVLLAGLAACALAGVSLWTDALLELPSVRSRLARILRRPVGALAELATTPRTPELGDADGLAAGGRPEGPLRVDAFVHPACEACPELVAGLRRLAARHASHVDLRVHLPRRDPRRGEEAVLLATLAAVALDDGPDAFFERFATVERDPWRFLALAERGRRPLARALGAELIRESSLEAGRAAVTASTRVARSLDLGTPALFVDRRAFTATLDHLDALLARRADDLLRELGSSRTPSGLPA